MDKMEPNTEKKYEKVLADFENKCSDNHKEYESYGYGVRHLQTLMIFLSLCIIYMSRAHINATIVAMTDVPKEAILVNLTDSNNNTYSESLNITLEETANNEQDLNNGTEYDDINRIFCNETEFNATVCEFFSNENRNDSSTNNWNVFRVYAWSKPIQEMVLGSFFLGYMIMMSPMGLVCQRWGGKLPLQISLFSSAVITFLTPWLAVMGDYKAVSLSRLAMGLTQAGTYPGINTLIAKWVPVSERGRLCTYVYTGSLIGSIMAYHLSGFLAVSRFGWPSIFWVTGTLSLLMGLLMTWFVAPSPQQHLHISEQEKNFILGGVKDQTEKRYSMPWKAVMTSKPVWACFSAHVGSSTIFIFLFSQIPTYIHHAIGVNIRNSGLLSSLPYLSNFVTSICMGILSDYFINKNIMTTKQVRIVSNSIACVGPAIGLYALTYISHPALAISCLIFCMACLAGVHTGWMVNYIDLAPNFSGSLMATGNTIMNICSLLLAFLISNTISDMTNVYQWRIVVCIVGTFGLLSNIIYIIFMSADIQLWNDTAYQPTMQDDPDTTEEKADLKNIQS